MAHYSTAAWPTAVIDPHMHQWDPCATPRHVSRQARLVRPMSRVPRGMRWLARRSDREFIGHPHHVLKPYLPTDYRIDAAELPVATVVHIEAAWRSRLHIGSVDETRWVASLPFGENGSPTLGAVVVNTDPRWPDAATVLDAHLAASPMVRGVRYSAAHHPDPGVRDFADAPHTLSAAKFLRGFDAVAERGLNFELWLYAHQLPDATVLVGKFPETTFVLDHYATPVGLFGPRGRRTARTARERAGMLALWRDEISTLAAFPNVVAKHSGLGMPLLGSTVREPIASATLAEVTDMAAPLIRHLHDSFGPERTMWASNYPIDKPVHSIPASARILTEVLGADAVPHQLFHDVARRTYRLADSPLRARNRRPSVVSNSFREIR
ncbi:amidohydrolase family protein [Nocardia sp. NPDC058518]|uniref:amidohydrolase family protein n=1 Tax=Nocardia sp. NPDC058518 TaxID=3346534 RepID=UPI003658F136